LEVFNRKPESLPAFAQVPTTEVPRSATLVKVEANFFLKGSYTKNNNRSFVIFCYSK